MAEKYWTAEDLKDYGFSAADEPEVHSITSAESRHSESVDERFKSYAFKMFLRVVCIVAALCTHGWLMWAFIVAAGILPWVAVVVANGNDRARNGDFSAYLTPEQQFQLASGQKEREKGATGDAQPSSTDRAEDFSCYDDVLEGEIVEDEAE